MNYFLLDDNVVELNCVALGFYLLVVLDVRLNDVLGICI